MSDSDSPCGENTREQIDTHLVVAEAIEAVWWTFGRGLPDIASDLQVPVLHQDATWGVARLL